MRDTPDGYEIGSPLPREISLLPGIEVAAAAIFPREDLTPELRTEGLPLPFLREASSEGRLWVARTVEGAVPVGFAAAVLLDESAHLHEMDVLPAHQGRGIGRALVLQVAGWARGSGFPTLTLTTFRHLPWNGPFYAQVGFREIPEEDLGPELLAMIREEAEDGLDPARRVAMSLDLLAA